MNGNVVANLLVC